MNRKELQHVHKEVEEELRTLRGGEQLSAKFARHCRDLLEHIKEMEQRNGVFVSDCEVGLLKVLHEHGSIALLQSRSLARQPLFRAGALLQVEELRPALAWVRILIQQLARTEVPSDIEEKPWTKCDHSVEGCPERCVHKYEHQKDEHENCKSRICGGQHVECKEVE